MNVFTDPRERNYSATSIDQIAAFIVSDPDRIIKSIFHANALPKWRRHTEFFDEFTQDLSIYIFDRIHRHRLSGDTQALITWFNGDSNRTFSRWLVTYTRNTARSASSSFSRRNSERASVHFDDLDELEPVSFDNPFEFDEVRNLSAIDLDVLEWLLNTKDFAIYTPEQIAIYRGWIEFNRSFQRRQTVKDYVTSSNLEYDSTRLLISRITQRMRAKVKMLNNQ